jgi:uncharacterized membrane protein
MVHHRHFRNWRISKYQSRRRHLCYRYLAVLWLWFARSAYTSIRAGDVVAHRRWAIRTFAMTYAGVTLRLWLGVLIGAQVGLVGTPDDVAFDRAYLLVAFLSWVPNLLVAERLLATRPERGDPAADVHTSST